MNKKILVPVAVLTTGALLLTGCGGNSTAAASRRASDAARKTDTIVKKLDTYTDAHYNFPQSFQGTGFRMKNQDCFGCPTPTNFQSRMDGMHGLCADISNANARKTSLVQEVRHEAQTARNLSHQLRGKRVRNADWNEFNRAHDNLKTNLRELSKQRGKMHRDVRMVPRGNKNINVDAMTNRYSTINNKLTARTTALENIRQDLNTMNSAMKSAIETPKPTKQASNRNTASKRQTLKKQQNTTAPRARVGTQDRQDGFVYPTTQKQPMVHKHSHQSQVRNYVQHAQQHHVQQQVQPHLHKNIQQHTLHVDPPQTPLPPVHTPQVMPEVAHAPQMVPHVTRVHDTHQLNQDTHHAPTPQTENETVATPRPAARPSSFHQHNHARRQQPHNQHYTSAS